VSAALIEFRAPGRVNLIGGHVDFHEGPVVCAAINRFITAGVTPRSDARVRVTSSDLKGVVELSADGSSVIGELPRWGRPVAAMLAELADRGRPPVGFEAIVSSDLAIGGGLSSSAAFEVLMGRVASAVANWSIPPRELALAAQAAEHRGTGVACGIQDQMAIALGGLIHLDCRTLQSRSLQLPAGTALLIADSGISRQLEGSPWSARRADSFAAAQQAGVRVLRDATALQVADHPQGRHVVSEMARVSAFTDAVDQGDAVTAGRLMVQSHESSRDDYGSSIPELDRIVMAACQLGAYGARLTGGGFGGWVVALVPDSRRQSMAEELSIGLGVAVQGVDIVTSS